MSIFALLLFFGSVLNELNKNKNVCNAGQEHVVNFVVPFFFCFQDNWTRIVLRMKNSKSGLSDFTGMHPSNMMYNFSLHNLFKKIDLFIID